MKMTKDEFVARFAEAENDKYAEENKKLLDARREVSKYFYRRQSAWLRSNKKGKQFKRKLKGNSNMPLK